MVLPPEQPAASRPNSAAKGALQLIVSRLKRRGEVVFLTVGRSKLMVLRLDTCGLFTRGGSPRTARVSLLRGVEQAGVGDGAI